MSIILNFTLETSENYDYKSELMENRGHQWHLPVPYSTASCSEAALAAVISPLHPYHMAESELV